MIIHVFMPDRLNIRLYSLVHVHTFLTHTCLYFTWYVFIFHSFSFACTHFGSFVPVTAASALTCTHLPFACVRLHTFVHVCFQLLICVYFCAFSFTLICSYLYSEPNSICNSPNCPSACLTVSLSPMVFFASVSRSDVAISIAACLILILAVH